MVKWSNDYQFKCRNQLSIIFIWLWYSAIFIKWKYLPKHTFFKWKFTGISFTGISQLNIQAKLIIFSFDYQTCSPNFSFSHVATKVGNMIWVKALPVVNGVWACMMLGKIPLLHAGPIKIVLVLASAPQLDWTINVGYHLATSCPSHPFPINLNDWTVYFIRSILLSNYIA